MRTAILAMHGIDAGILVMKDKSYELTYFPAYTGEPLSLTLPVRSEPYYFNQFPAFLDGLLPEGLALEALLRKAKFDRDDYFGQLLCVGQDLVGAITVREQS
jgi:serine/threonine-protein kinase HipA